MKKLLIGLTSLVAISGIVAASLHETTTEAKPISVAQNKTTISNDKKYELASSHAKIPYYENIDSLADQSDIIVTGHAVDKQNVYEIKTDSGEVIDTMGKTPFKIDKVVKGDIGNGSLITVMEHGRIDNGVYENIEGYVKMNDVDPYLLFLRKTGEDTYTVRGVYQGKFNIQEQQAAQQFTANTITSSELENLDYIGEDTEHFNTLKTEAINEFIK